MRIHGDAFTVKSAGARLTKKEILEIAFGDG